MPDVQALASTFREYYTCDGVYLSTPEEVAVMVATVDTVPTYPVFSLSYTTVSGDYTLIEEDFEVEVTRTGAFVGRLRVAAGAATSTVLQVNEVSKTRISIEAGDVVTVLRSIRVRDKLVAANATFNKDSRIPYTDQNENLSPLANDGGHFAAKWQGVNINVPFFGNLRIQVDFNSDGPYSHDWTVFGPDADTSTDENPVFTFTQPGTNWVRHIITDDETGATWKKWSVVIIDANPIPIRITGLGSSVEDPWTLSFRALSGASIEVLSYGAMTILHEDESTGSAGNRVTSRSRVKGVFFLLNETAQIEPDMGELTFNAISPLGILFQLPGFSQELEQVLGTPVNWQEYESGLTSNALLVYLTRWHSTYANLFDVVLPEINYVYGKFTVQKQTPADQLVEIADAVEAYVRADRSGALMMRQNLNLGGELIRADADILFHFMPRDVKSIESLTIEHRPRVAYVLYRMFSGDEPLESESGVPAEAEEFNTVERKIGLLQGGTEFGANERCGRHYALQNETYFGLPVARMTVLHRGSYDFIEPAYDNWVLFSGTYEVAGRVYVFDEVRFWIESVQIIYEAVTDDYGVTQYEKSLRVEYVGETDGHAGIAKLPDGEGWNGLIDYSTDDFWGQDSIGTGTPPSLSRVTANIVTPSNTGLVFTSTFDTPSPTWDAEDWSDGSPLDLLDPGESIYHNVQKPAVPRTFVIATNTKVRVIEDALDSAHVMMTYALRATATSIVQRRVQVERGDNEIAHVLSNYSDGLWSEGFINGTPITPVRIGVNTNLITGFDAFMPPPLFVDPNNPLIAYSIAFDGTIWRWYKTVDGGVSWNTTSDFNWSTNRRAGSIERSFSDSSRMFVGYNAFAAADVTFYPMRRATVSANSADLSLGMAGKRNLRTFDSDPNTLLLVAWDEKQFSGGTWGIFKSHDSGDNFSTILADGGSATINQPGPGGTLGGDGSGFVWNYGSIYFHPNIYTLTDFSQMEDKTGTGYPASPFVPHGLFGFS